MTEREAILEKIHQNVEQSHRLQEELVAFDESHLRYGEFELTTKYHRSFRVEHTRDVIQFIHMDRGIYNLCLTLDKTEELAKKLFFLVAIAREELKQ